VKYIVKSWKGTVYTYILRRAEEDGAYMDRLRYLDSWATIILEQLTLCRQLGEQVVIDSSGTYRDKCACHKWQGVCKYADTKCPLSLMVTRRPERPLFTTSRTTSVNPRPN
jgi:hypothetical protein